MKTKDPAPSYPSGAGSQGTVARFPLVVAALFSPVTRERACPQGNSISAMKASNDLDEKMGTCRTYRAAQRNIMLANLALLWYDFCRPIQDFPRVGVNVRRNSIQIVGDFMESILLSRQDAARLLAISLRKFDGLIQTKQVNIIKIGKRTLIARVELEKFARYGTGTKQTGVRNGK